eukprot:6207147-Pleurochrysis_carterae.AAC.1
MTAICYLLLSSVEERACMKHSGTQNGVHHARSACTDIHTWTHQNPYSSYCCSADRRCASSFREVEGQSNLQKQYMKLEARALGHTGEPEDPVKVADSSPVAPVKSAFSSQACAKVNEYGMPLGFTSTEQGNVLISQHTPVLECEKRESELSRGNKLAYIAKYGAMKDRVLEA